MLAPALIIKFQMELSVIFAFKIVLSVMLIHLSVQCVLQVFIFIRVNA